MTSWFFQNGDATSVTGPLSALVSATFGGHRRPIKTRVMQVIPRSLNLEPKLHGKFASTISTDFAEFPQLTTTELEQMISEQGQGQGLMADHNMLNFGLTGNPGPHYNVFTHSQPMEEFSHPAAQAPTSTGPQSRPRVARHNSGEPWVEIVEQPKQRGLRFRYQCEGRSAGSIPGENSTNEKKTFPTIKIHNHKGQAIIVVSCVTKEAEPNCKPHPHSLVGRDCKKGVCTVRVKDASVVSFPQLGIQCAKKKDVEEALRLRKEINVDPFQTGFDHASSNIDLNVVRLCFQVFLPDVNGKITRVVPPVVSLSIHDKKALNDLIICRVDKSSGKARGGDEVFLLCEKVGKDDIRVRFFEDVDGEVVWEGFGDFGQGDVHRQYAIVFKTPKYKEEYITRPVNVNMQLLRPSDMEASDPIQFTYMPEDPDPDRIEEKRKRKGDWLNKVMPSSAGGMHQGMSMSSRGSESSIEPLSSTSSAPPVANMSFRTPDNTSMGNVTVAPSVHNTQPITVDATRLLNQHFQQHQQQPQAEGGAGQVSAASGGSQPGSLDSLLSFMSSMPVGALLSAIDNNTIQSLLDQSVSLSSASDNGASSSMAEGSRDPNMVSVDAMQLLDASQQQDFLEVQAALDALNKS
ncbi:hypothetical protein BaRGS_00036563 [Batillaria attramentaria]|uniref:RHD domain-containing protein n=1 Tax=Batillaria attramentaria TaxID=370345 RepID=A0ABD0JBK0_9CAEN